LLSKRTIIRTTIIMLRERSTDSRGDEINRADATAADKAKVCVSCCLSISDSLMILSVDYTENAHADYGIPPTKKRPPGWAALDFASGALSDSAQPLTVLARKDKNNAKQNNDNAGIAHGSIDFLT
jgi:hypothetical protein